MRTVTPFAILLLLSAAVSGPRVSAETFPPEGFDVLSGRATHQIEILGAGIFLTVMDGPTEVWRGNPYPYTASGGDEAIDTVMTSMNMTGSVGPFPGELHLQGAPPESPGMIIDTNPDPSDSYPAESFFDIFFEITVYGTPMGDLTIHNQDPLRMASVIHTIPPDLVLDFYEAVGWIPIGSYTPRAPNAPLELLPLPLYYPDDTLAGYLLNGTHSPEPGTFVLLAAGALLTLRRTRC